MTLNNNKTTSFRSMLAVATMAILATFATQASSQDKEPRPDKSMREVIEAAENAERLIEEHEQSDPKAIDAGTTPLATLLGLRDAIQKSNFEKAGRYLDMRYLPEELEEYSSEELLKALALTWAQQNIIDLSSISDEPEGDLNDGLPSYRDQVGLVVLSTEEVPIYLQRIPDGRGGKVWKLSNATVAKIPAMWDELGYSDAAIYVSNLLPDFKFMGMSNWQFFATIIFFIFAWPAASLISFLLMKVVLLIPNGFPLGIQRFFRGPMRFFIFILVARIMVDQLGLSMTARVFMESSGVDYLAYTVLFMGILSLIRDYNIRKMERAGNLQYVALLKPVTTIVKVLIITVIGLYWAESAGYNMSTIIAGLGVGSLAVALAAQKTLENLIGALTLYTARPVDPGNLCRFGSVIGTIEEIGLRSTVIRTLDRSQVAVPNSVFSSGEIENLSVRDRIRFYRKVRLQLKDAEQLRFILAQVRELFYAHPKILPNTVSIRLEEISDATAILRMDSGVDTTDYQTYLAVAEDLNLRIIEVVHGAGAIFSGPGQSMQLNESPTPDAEKQARVEQALAQWREQDRLPFPNPSAEDIASLRNTLDYPPKGAPD
jgi:MscS family membrane protein